MIPATPPKFHWGQPVAAAVDLFNDGSFPGAAEESLLVVAGTAGAVVQTGVHTESGTNVYMVEFGTHVVGCLEDKIVPLATTGSGEPITEDAP